MSSLYTLIVFMLPCTRHADNAVTLVLARVMEDNNAFAIYLSAVCVRVVYLRE